MFFKSDGDFTLLTTILLIVGMILGIFILIVLGIAGFRELSAFLFYNGTIINLIKGLLFISITIGVPVEINAYFEDS